MFTIYNNYNYDDTVIFSQYARNILKGVNNNMTLQEIQEVLRKHEMWLNDEPGGERANLYGANLEWANLENADLRDADLQGVNLSYANLENADLQGAILTKADLTHANLSHANLKGSALLWASLLYSNLLYADLQNADLSNADLRYADLRNTTLSKTNLKYAVANMHTLGYHLACPEEGSFVAYKRAGNYIVKLLVLEDAKRSSATSSKCRCSAAKVLDIKHIRTGLKVVEVPSNYDSKFIYRVGEIVKVDNFDDDRWNECAPGIHFFMNRENAINY